MKKITIFTLCLSLFLVGSVSAQKEVWVAAVAAGAANGTSEADAYGSFTTALADITGAGDVLKVVGTVPAVGQSLNAKTFQYTIEGVGVGAALTGSTTGAARMFTINAASPNQNVTFKNITFKGTAGVGVTLAPGGGVLYSGVAVAINFENCRFEGNSLASTVTTGGGALSFTNSTVTITDCLFKENQAFRNGGAIAVYNNSNVNITGCTFYKNSTTDITQQFGGAALYVTGANSVVTIDHCTFFKNNIGHPNQDYGTIRSDNGNTTIKNSLFYDNKVTNTTATPPVLGGPSDWGSSPNGIQTFSNSLGQWINSNIDNKSNFISFIKCGLSPLPVCNPADVAADLTSSNLRFDDTPSSSSYGKVIYDAVAAGTNSPIDFGDDGNDVGAWDSGLTLIPLSVKDNEFAAIFSISYNAKTKNLKVLRSNDDSVSLEIYNLMGSKVLSRKNASKEENISASALQSGVYILVAKGSENKTFAQKLVIN